jgi:hypothetical protein
MTAVPTQEAPAMLAVLLSVALSAAATPTGVTLTGVVSDKAGRPLPGATVFVRMAAPRKGGGVL